jgi:hypothetical protein
VAPPQGPGLEIENHEELEAWLEDKPHEVAVVLAARAALRVAPVLVRILSGAGNPEFVRLSEWRRFLSSISADFRATALARSKAVIPSRVENFRSGFGPAFNAVLGLVPSHPDGPRDALDSTVGALRAAMYVPIDKIYTDAAGYACTAVVHAGFAAGNVVSADAVDAAGRAAHAAGSDFGTAIEAARAAAPVGVARAAIWRATSRDASFIDNSGSASALGSVALWPGGAPDWATDYWRRLQDALVGPDHRDEGWRVWIDWYQRRLDGVADPEEVELAFLLDDALDLWENPAAANAEIARRLEAARKPRRPPDWDFFISYANEDEAFAREVVEVLEKAGHTTFAQYQDIAPGANFVREMQRGLTASGRVVALYSPDYESSDHCRAEWSAAYNADPSGKDRKLVPFMLRPTTLNSLARQVVYKSLVGLTKEQRKAAILAAIAPPPPKRSLQEAQSILAETASPKPVAKDGRLDVTANSLVDRPYSDQDLVELPYRQRTLIKTLLSALQTVRQTPPWLRTALRAYAEHLEQYGSQPFIGLLGDQRSAVEAEFREKGPDFWGAGPTKLFENFFANDDKFKTHFPLKNEENFADVQIDEAEVSPTTVEKPLEKVAETMAPLVEKGQATPEIGKIVANEAQFAKDITPLPPDPSSFVPGSRRVTLKRRFVLGALGFLVALYNVLGSTASIATTPQGAALMEAVRDAIAKLSSLLL